MASNNETGHVQIMVGPKGEPLALLPLRDLLMLADALRDALERTHKLDLSPAAAKEVRRVRNNLAHLAEDTVKAGERFVWAADVLKEIATYFELIRTEDAEEAPDLAAFRAGKDNDEETVPLALFDRLAAGEHPIKVYREHRGLTQKELAERAGISPLYISQIETGKRSGSMKLLRRLAKALEVDLADLAA